MAKPTPDSLQHSLDVLQSMINLALIETAKALRINSREESRVLVTNAKVREAIPGAIDNFHNALDDIETEILRAKSALSRDLGNLQSARIALEAPVIPVKDEELIKENTIEEYTSAEKMDFDRNAQTAPVATMTQEKPQTQSPEEIQSTEDKKPIEVPPSAEPSQETVEDTKGHQGPTPPSSSTDVNQNSDPIGLGINTEDTANASAPDTAELNDPNIDSLFDDMGEGDNTVDSDINFESMHFDIADSASNTLTQDPSQAHNAEFDLSSFDQPSQDFAMPELQASNNPNVTNTTDNDANKELNDLFDLGDNTGGDDLLDLELGGLDGTQDSVFEDMFYANADGNDMEHGTFDDEFFGLDNRTT